MKTLTKWLFCTGLLGIMLWLVPKDGNIVLYAQLASLYAFLMSWAVYWDFGATVKEDIERAKDPLEKFILKTMTFFGYLILATEISMIFGWIPGRFIITYNPKVAVIGSIITIFGILGTFWCKYGFLKQNWSGNASQAPKWIVDTGPYAVVRNPIYTFALFMFIGMPMTFPTRWIIVASSVVIFGYFIITLVEEKNLMTRLELEDEIRSTRLQEEYLKYMMRVKRRLIPFIW